MLTRTDWGASTLAAPGAGCQKVSQSSSPPAAFAAGFVAAAGLADAMRAVGGKGVGAGLVVGGVAWADLGGLAGLLPASFGNDLAGA